MEHRLVSTEDRLEIGYQAAVEGEGVRGVAIGPDAHATGDGATAIGKDSGAAADSVAVGDHAEAGGGSSIAVGSGAGASGEGQVAIGAGVGLGGTSSRAIAIGQLADAGVDGIAIGAGVYAPANQTVIGGPSSLASFGGDLAIPVVTDPPTTPPADPTKAVIRFCSGNGAVYVWSGAAWSVIG